MTPSHITQMRRREAIMAGLGLVAAGSTRLGSSAAAATGARASAACVLTPEVTAGPYYIANHITRRNITDGQAGMPLRLRLTVQDTSSCRAISGANVEVWHANAHGAYSGYSGAQSPGAGPGGHVTPNTSTRFLRGHQVTDASGLAIFDTIYPGWYQGRAPHIHVKVHVGGSVVHTGQLFFSDVLSDAVYRSGAYASHGQPDTTDAADSIYRQAGGESAQLAISKSGTGYVGAITMGVRR
jgi:protocatechuate 3,4-dioxygenase beta subunit